MEESKEGKWGFFFCLTTCHGGEPGIPHMCTGAKTGNTQLRQRTSAALNGQGFFALTKLNMQSSGVRADD